MKKCPYCKEEVQDDAIKCKHCQSDLNKTVPKKGMSKTLGCLLIVGAFCVFVLVATSLGGSDKADNTQTTTVNSTVNSNQNSSTKLSTGSTGVLTLANLNTAYLAIDKDSYEQLSRALTINDTAAVANLVVAGKIFDASKGSKVLVIDSTFASLMVRITEEPAGATTKSVGKSGWLPYEWVSAQ